MSTMSDIEKYDRSVWTYLSDISEKIVFAPTQSAFRTITKREQFSDNKPWNFISYHRSSTFDVDWSRMNNPATISGDRVSLVAGTEDKVQAKYVQHIPVNLEYVVDLWASKNVEVQVMATSLISKLYMTDQVLQVPINPDGEMGRFHILDISWSDNSDIERETEIGKIYRHTISFTVDSKITLIREDEKKKFCCPPINIYE